MLCLSSPVQGSFDSFFFFFLIPPFFKFNIYLFLSTCLRHNSLVLILVPNLPWLTLGLTHPRTKQAQTYRDHSQLVGYFFWQGGGRERSGVTSDFVYTAKNECRIHPALARFQTNDVTVVMYVYRVFIQMV
jgi:hypothetical protein